MDSIDVVANEFVAVQPEQDGALDPLARMLAGFDRIAETLQPSGHVPENDVTAKASDYRGVYLLTRSFDDA